MSTFYIVPSEVTVGEQAIIQSDCKNLPQIIATQWADLITADGAIVTAKKSGYVVFTGSGGNCTDYTPKMLYILETQGISNEILVHTWDIEIYILLLIAFVSFIYKISRG